MSEWRDQLWDRLGNAQLTSGGWPYVRGGDAHPEPTALACLALAAGRNVGDRAARGASYLARQQINDGSVPAIRGVPASTWPTALALLVWRSVPGWATHAGSAIDWLLRAEGKPFVSDPRIYGHDTQQIGWAWIDDTHSWVEPTAWAMLALRASGQSDHKRYKDGSRLLRDRAVSSGGWNYGNGRMFGADLRPFPETTGLALTAMAGEPRDPIIDASLRYLLASSATMLAPLAISWTILGLSAWNERPAQSEFMLVRATAPLLKADTRPATEALILLAGMSECPFLSSLEEQSRGSIAAMESNA